MKNFTYDTLDRLPSANAAGGSGGLYSENYTYDPSTGNLSSKAGVNYTYSPTRVHAVTSLSNGNSYGYDANGNMTSRTVGGVTYTLTYDAENRLVSLTGGGVTAAYTYDGDGNRVKTVVNGTTVTYIGNYFEWSNSVGTKYYYAGGVRVAVRVGTVLDYLFSDHLGSTSITADSAGNLAGGMRYTAFGETRFSGGATPTSFRFTGQRQAEAGLYYYVARMYDPALGRMTQADTIVSDTGSAKSYDRFGYVLNNPVLYNDPSGHDAGCPGRDASECSDSNTPKPTTPVGDDTKKNTPDPFSYAVLGIDAVTAESSALRAIVADYLGVAIIAAGCGATGAETGGLGCGASIWAALVVDVGIAYTYGTFENVLSVGSLTLTALFIDQGNILEYSGSVLDRNFQITSIAVGKDTIVSARSLALGLIPESNTDALVNFSQLKYDLDRMYGDKPGGSVEIYKEGWLYPGLQDLKTQMFWKNWW